MDIGKLYGQTPLSVGNDAARRAGDKNSARAAGDGAAGVQGVDAGRSEDVASISTSGRETLAVVESLAERARGDDPDRAAIVAAAQARLESGALDGPAVDAAVARRLLG